MYIYIYIYRMCIYSDISLLHEEAFFGCLVNEEAFECKGSPSSSAAAAFFGAGFARAAFLLFGAFAAAFFGAGFVGAAAIIDAIAKVKLSMLVCII